MADWLGSGVNSGLRLSEIQTMKKLIVSLSVAVMAFTVSVQAGDAKDAKAAPCCDKAKAGCAGAKAGCSKDSQAKKVDFSQKGGALLVSKL